MRNLIYLSLFLIVLFSCEQDANDSKRNFDLVSTKWKVVKVKSNGDESYSYTNENYILEFVDDTFYDINLDVNYCNGEYKLFDNGEAEIEWPSCTKACCDSEFAENLIHLLSQVKQYYEENNELIFIGNGIIVLEKL